MAILTLHSAPSSQLELNLGVRMQFSHIGRRLASRIARVHQSGLVFEQNAQHCGVTVLGTPVRTRVAEALVRFKRISAATGHPAHVSAVARRTEGNRHSSP